MNETLLIEQLVLVLKSDWSNWSDNSRLLTVCVTPLQSVFVPDRLSVCLCISGDYVLTYSDYTTSDVK